MASPSKTIYKSPLHETAATSITDIWNDSCSGSDLNYAMENGAVGATSNPVIVGTVLEREMAQWGPRIDSFAAANPAADEDQLLWMVTEEMAVKAAALLYPVWQETQARKGWLSLQTNPKYHRSADRLVDQAVHFHSLAPNIQVKIPATPAGIPAIEEATYRGVNINATVSFTVPQSIAVAEAIERGLDRRKQDGLPLSGFAPVCTIMVGRIDDWLRVVAARDNICVDPGSLNWAGVAVMKNAYRIYRERGYRTRLLAAAYRCHMHWSEFIGGDVVLSIPPDWQRLFNSSSVPVVERMKDAVDSRIFGELHENFEDFRKAYDEDGLTVPQFADYGPTLRTLRQFLAAYDHVVQLVRDRLVPDPDRKRVSA
jgi:transaldolase